MHLNFTGVFMNHVAEFKKLFGSIARHHRRSDVFRDFVMMAGLSVANAYYKSDLLESEYMQTVKRYSKEDAIAMSGLLGIVVDALSVPHDFLGKLYMELELGNACLSQYFTPNCISDTLSALHMGGIKETIAKQGYVTLGEGCCGSGVMIISVAKVMLESGLNPQTQLWFEGTDIDPLAAMMTLLQTNLLGLSGRVIVGNSLTQKHQRIYHTLFHFKNGWDERFESHKKFDAMKKFFNELALPVEKAIVMPSHAVKKPTVVTSRNLYDALF